MLLSRYPHRPKKMSTVRRKERTSTIILGFLHLKFEAWGRIFILVLFIHYSNRPKEMVDFHEAVVH